MNQMVLMAAACLLNAIVTCGVLQLLYKRVIKSDLRYIVTLVTYFLFCFLMTSSGQGLLNIDPRQINWVNFALYATAGVAVCIVLYVVNLVNKRNIAIYGEAAMQQARKRKKK